MEPASLDVGKSVRSPGQHRAARVRHCPPLGADFKASSTIMMLNPSDGNPPFCLRPRLFRNATSGLGGLPAFARGKNIRILNSITKEAPTRGVPLHPRLHQKGCMTTQFLLVIKTAADGGWGEEEC
ncbi:unnamed protein product, partial [Iphiclides podalirius]